jgi:uncharacterized membrane protein YgdD (TMEM256/DUF423 family)
MIDPSQAKVLEVLASAATNATVLFFAILAGLFGVAKAMQSGADRSELKWPARGIAAAAVVSLAYLVLVLVALRYQTPAWYALTLCSGGLILIIAVVASVWLAREIPT